MPPEGSPERKQLDSVINETLKNSWSGISNMISAEAELEGIKHSQDMSFAKERMLPSAQKVLGETIKSKAEPLGSLLNFISKHYEQMIQLHPRTECLETPITVTKKQHRDYHDNPYERTEIEIDNNRRVG